MERQMPGACTGRKPQGLSRILQTSCFPVQNVDMHQIRAQIRYKGLLPPDTGEWIGLNKARTVLYSVEELSPRGRIRAFGIGELFSFSSFLKLYMRKKEIERERIIH